MPRYNEKQLKQIHDERKIQLMQAAIRIFAKRGILGTKISMISEEAGVTHGLFYHYFKSKEELFTLLIKEAVDTSIREIKNLQQAPGSPLEKIQLLTYSILDENGVPFFMLLHQARNAEGVTDEVKQMLIQYPMGYYVEILRPIFEDGQQKGEIVEGDTDELISAYLTILSGIMVWVRGTLFPE